MSIGSTCFPISGTGTVVRRSRRHVRSRVAAVSATKAVLDLHAALERDVAPRGGDVIETDDGLVLRTFKLGETSKIVSFLGRKHGKLRLVARGARTSRSRHGASLELGNEVDIVFSLSPGRELGALRESSLRHGWLSGAKRLELLASGLAMLELLDRLVPQGASEAGLLREACLALRTLHESTDRHGALVVFCAFETRLLGSFGLLPHLEACAQCGAASTALGKATLDLGAGTLLCGECGDVGTQRMRLGGEVVRILQDLSRATWPSLASSSIGKDDLRSVGRVLHRLLEAHLEAYRAPRSLQLLPSSASRAASGSPAQIGDA